MALLLAWLSVGACALLAVGCAALYLDRLGQRRTIAALQSQVAGLRRDVAAMTRPAPTLPLPPPAEPRTVERYGRITLPSLAPLPEPSWTETRAAQLVALGVGRRDALVQARLEGLDANASPGAARWHCCGAECVGVDVCACPCSGCVGVREREPG